MRVTLDTNVLVSALLFGGLPSTILDIIKDGKAELFVSPFILDEFQRKLETKFGFTQDLAREARAGVEAIANVVHPKKTIHIIKRKDSDNRILECAVEAKAQVLVTGNMRDIRSLGAFQEIAILTPREFLEKYFHGT